MMKHQRFVVGYHHGSGGAAAHPVYMNQHNQPSFTRYHRDVTTPICLEIFLYFLLKILILLKTIVRNCNRVVT